MLRTHLRPGHAERRKAIKNGKLPQFSLEQLVWLLAIVDPELQVEHYVDFGTYDCARRGPTEANRHLLSLQPVLR